MGDSLWNKAPSPFRYVNAKDTDRQRREQLQSEMRKGEGPLDAMGSFVAKKDIIGTFGKIWLTSVDELPFHLPSASHPSRLSQSIRFERHESYSKFPLAIYFTYGNACFNVTLSIHPRLSFPTVSTSLFFMSASPLLPCKQDHQYHLSDLLHLVSQALVSPTSLC